VSDYSVKLNSKIIKKRKITPWVENFSSCILFWLAVIQWQFYRLNCTFGPLSF